MSRTGLVSFGLASCGVIALQAFLEPMAPEVGLQAVGITQSSAGLAALSDTSTGAVLADYCVACHNERLRNRRTGPPGVRRRSGRHPRPAVGKGRQEAARRRDATSRRPRPDQATYGSVITSLGRALDRAATAAPNPGRPAIHRLNRAEYANVIRDLLDLQIDGEALLPPDDSGYGFDNIADVLSISPGLMERYLLAAKKVSRLAIGDATIRPEVTTYRVPFEMVQDTRMSDDLPFGSRGGVAIRHYFPLDGEYVVRTRMQRNSFNIGLEIRGLDVVNDIDVRLDGSRVAQFTLPVRQYLDRPYTDEEDLADAGLVARFAAKAGTRVVGVTFPKDTWYVEGVGMSRLPVASDAIKEHRVSAVATDGAIPASFKYGEWVCSRNRQHNRQPHEPV